MWALLRPRGEKGGVCVCEWFAAANQNDVYNKVGRYLEARWLHNGGYFCTALEFGGLA